jgi:hypothetical protein
LFEGEGRGRRGNEDLMAEMKLILCDERYRERRDLEDIF